MAATRTSARACLVTPAFIDASCHDELDVAYRRPALLTSLALKDAHSALVEEDIAKLNRDELA